MPAFWDASAVVHVCVPSQASRHARVLLRAHPPVVWWGTFVEVRSALARLRRQGALSGAAFQASLDRVTDLLLGSREIQPSDSVRDLAAAQLDRFPIRAGDALQLGAALVWSKQKPRGRLFVVNDARLSAAAREAGFDVVGT
jgi:predicted nucleic acid-binding protein